MYKTLKMSINIILIFLFISGVVVLSLRSLVSFFIYPIGALFLYYIFVLIIASSLKKQCNTTAIAPILVSILILILIPILWLLIAPEQLLNLLMPNLKIDMR